MALRSSALTPGVRFNEAAGRYTSAATGRFVSGAQVRAALDTTLDRAGKQAQALAEGLRGGTITLRDWQTQMATAVKSVHLASSALAKGGWAQMSQADFGRVGSRVKSQYGYLRNFALQIEAGTQKLDGTLGRRALLYIQAGRATYHHVERREQALRGATQERSVRSARDSCEECISEEAAGWRAIGEMVPVGERECGPNCQCSVDYRAGEED